MHFNIHRYSHSKDMGTFSILTIGSQKFNYVEQDWENNLPNISCVPNGEYLVEFHNSPSKGECYILTNKDLNIGKYKGESKRFGCLIHSANIASQLEGCGAPGMGLGMLRGKWSVTNSRVALGAIMGLLGKTESHTVTISSNFPYFAEA